MNMKKNLVCFAFLMTASLNVMAENVGEVVNDTSRVVDLDEVVIVAQPKETVRLRKQPLSSTLFGEKEMARLGVRDLSQLSAFVPSFSMPEYGSRLTSSMYIRGIGSRINNSAVGIYYDNIPLVSKSAFNTYFYMLDRVDVLRGPQGTLYGANTEGGIVRVYSKNPMNYQGTDINLGVGTAFQRKAEIAHYQRPNDQLAFMVAGFYNGRDGFFDNTNLNEKNDKMNEAGAKLRLLWKPTEKLLFDLTSDYQYTNQNGFPYGYYHVDEDETDDPSTTYMNAYRRQMVNTGLNISYDFGKMLLTSTTSHQYLWDKMNMDQDYLVDDYMQLEQRQKMNAVTQELALRSKSDSRWQHSTGLFASYQWLHTLGPVYFGDAMNKMILQKLVDVGMPERVLGMMQLSNNHTPGDFHTPQLNLGVYHETNLNVTDQLMLTLGLRYDYMKLKMDYYTESMFDLTVNMYPRPAVTNPYQSIYGSDISKSYSQVLPKFGLTWKFDESNNVYAVVSKGFRAGGYNLQGFSDIFQNEQQGIGRGFMSMMTAPMVIDHRENAEEQNVVNEQISYKPETSWNYEVGTHLTLFDKKVQADIALFYTQLHDQQLSVMSPDHGFGRIIVNAGKSYSCGAELALHGKAIDDKLSWGATYSFTHAKFKEYDDFDDAHNPISYKDNYVPFIPQHKFNVNGDYRFDLTENLFKSLTIGANVAGQGKTYWEADNAINQKFYATLGAHAALDMGQVVVDFWGRNLTNTHYNTFLVYSKMTRQNFAQLGLPLQLGVDVRMHF